MNRVEPNGRRRRRGRRRQRQRVRRLLCVIILIGLAAAAGIVIWQVRKGREEKSAGEYRVREEYIEDQTEDNAIASEASETTEAVTEDPADDGKIKVGDMEFLAGYTAQKTSATVTPGEDLVGSAYAILINEATGEIVAERDSSAVINPASMTKILTVLTAAENIPNLEQKLDDKFQITFEITDYAYVNECSTVGFDVDEEVPLRDLFYGTILPSGGDAAYALALYTAGSHEAFVDLMNRKLEELGLSETAHFTNSVGLYGEDHHCTVYDMAMILKAALQNDWCREVLSAHVYTTEANELHPEGIVISNLFLRRIEDHITTGTVVAAKTGYVMQSGNCAASYEISKTGVPYICVTGKASGAWSAIRDHVAMYDTYAK